MGLVLIIAVIILIVMGILGLFRSLGWVHVKMWRAILEIVIGVIVLIFAFFSGLLSFS